MNTTENGTPKPRTSRPKRSYAQTVSDAQVMTTALKANAATVAKRGIDAAFVADMEATRATAIAYNDEQEKLKADLKMKTEELDTKLKELLAQLSEARKVVKLAIPKAQWKEFGMEDKR